MMANYLSYTLVGPTADPYATGDDPHPIDGRNFAPYFYGEIFGLFLAGLLQDLVFGNN